MKGIINQMNKSSKLPHFLNSLVTSKLDYFIKSTDKDTTVILIDTPGKRYEAKFLPNDDVEVELFISDGRIFNKDILIDLIKDNTD